MISSKYPHLPHRVTDTHRSELLHFISSQQNFPTSSCAYLGSRREEVEKDLDNLDQPWLTTTRVLYDNKGNIIGAACIEWDTETDTAWIYGPWIEKQVTDHEAVALLKEVCEQTTTTRYEIFSDIAHQRNKSIAQLAGWSEGKINYSYSISREKIVSTKTTTAHPHVTPAVWDDLHALHELHQQTFPQTYAHARQLLAPDGDYTTFVVRDNTRLLGYCSGHIDNADLYLDYLAVSPDQRRQGIASRLIATFAAALPGTRVRLTVGEEAEAAIAMYETKGWERTAALRAYHYEKRGHNDA